MKKFFALFLALMMIFSMTAMAETVQSPSADVVPSPEAPVVPSPEAPVVPSPDAPSVPSPDAPGVESPDAGDVVESPDAEVVVDAFTSASVNNFYADYALVGDDLMNAVNSQSGCYIICTTNPDGTPNAGYFIFAIKKLNDKYYLQLGLADNQSKLNLEANGLGLAVYAANPTGEKAYAVSGARFYFVAIEDQAVVDALMVDARPGAMFFEITEVLPLG